MKLTKLLALIICSSLMSASASSAQSDLFGTAISVNGAAISNYEIDQRVRFYRAIGISGGLRNFAENALVEERIYLQAAERLDIRISNRDILEGAIEYAGGRNQSLEGFLNILGSSGVTKESYFDFVRAGLAWRRVVAARFVSKAQSIGVEEVDERLELELKQTNRFVNLMEIGIPVDPNDPEQSRLIANEIVSQINTAADFSETARVYSAVSSNRQGGRLGWLNYDGLNQQVLDLIETTSPGRITQTLMVNDVIYVFFVVDKRTEVLGANPTVIEFMTLQMTADAQPTASGALRQSRNCKDFKEAAREFPAESFEHLRVAAGQPLGGFEAALDNLDNNEITQVTRDEGTLVIVMLCKREYVADNETRLGILSQLQERRLDQLADSYLENLKASAVVRRK